MIAGLVWSVQAAVQCRLRALWLLDILCCVVGVDPYAHLCFVAGEGRHLEFNSTCSSKLLAALCRCCGSC